jgi:hypothetical protein
MFGKYSAHDNLSITVIKICMQILVTFRVEPSSSLIVNYNLFKGAKH